MPRPAIVAHLIALMCTCVFALPGYAASDVSETSSGSSVALASRENSSPFIVIGFLGGFVSHDERHHPEVQMIQSLRQEYPSNVYFGLFENRKVGEAYKIVLHQLGAKAGRTLLED